MLPTSSTFICKMTSKSIRCDLCNVEVSSLALLDTHKEGKKHQKKMEKRNLLESLAARSIYACGVPKHTFSSHEEVEDVFRKFGAVDQVHIDAERGSFAVVEFENQGSAEAAIREGSVQIGKHRAVIKHRKVDFDEAREKYEKETVNVDLVIDELLKHGGTFSGQVDRLAELYCLSEEQVNERLKYGQELTDALKHYFSSEIVICVFGSSITSIGTVDSDVDATLFFGSLSLEKEVGFSELDRNKLTLMTCSTDTLKARKVQHSELARLTPADRVRFMGKILNDIRRHNSAPVSDLFLILDARCPLLRFMFRRNCTIDLSIDNRLGFAKTSWIAETVKCDVSGNLRRFLVAVRFWALAHDLMRKDNTMRSHFNAYILNLLCIFFLESRSIIPPLQRGTNPVQAGKWDIDFSVHRNDLRNLDLSALIRDFFVWVVSLKLKDCVICPRLGSSLTIDEFHEAYPLLDAQGFKLAHLNIQDPFELSHNISQLVSEKNVSAMRQAMVHSLSSLKKNPESFISVLRFSLADTHGDSDLCISLPAMQGTSKECAAEIMNILSELLLFQPIFEPEAKRTRLAESDCTLIEVQIKARVWAGRRNKRRTVVKENPNIDAWDAEKMVSRAILLENGGKGEDVDLLLKLAFRLHGGILTLSLVRLSGSELDAHNLSHFLSQFLPKYYTQCNSRRSDSPMEL